MIHSLVFQITGYCADQTDGQKILGDAECLLTCTSGRCTEALDKADCIAAGFDASDCP